MPSAIALTDRSVQSESTQRLLARAALISAYLQSKPLSGNNQERTK